MIQYHRHCLSTTATPTISHYYYCSQSLQSIISTITLAQLSTTTNIISSITTQIFIHQYNTVNYKHQPTSLSQLPLPPLSTASQYNINYLHHHNYPPPSLKSIFKFVCQNQDSGEGQVCLINYEMASDSIQSFPFKNTLN